MGKVFTHMTMSLDGYIAGPDNQPGELFDWYQAGEVSVASPNEDISCGAQVVVVTHSAPADAAERCRDGLDCGKDTESIEGVERAGREIVGARLVAGEGGAIGREDAVAGAGKQDGARASGRPGAGDEHVNGLADTRVHRG